MTIHHDFDRLSGTLFVDGTYLKSQSNERISVIDPATEDQIAEIAKSCHHAP